MITVIIPTYNEEKVLTDCIESLRFQTLTDFEIIVVDDGSTDNTWQLLSEIRNSKFENCVRSTWGPERREIWEQNLQREKFWFSSTRT